MNKVQVNYVKNIETALQQYLKLGYELHSLENSAKVELRMNLWHPIHGGVCLARQWWDEMYPETKGQGFGLPETYVEIKTKSEEKHIYCYMLFKSIGLVDEVKNDDLSNVPVIKLKGSSTLLVNPYGCTWE